MTTSSSGSLGFYVIVISNGPWNYEEGVYITGELINFD